MGSVSFLPYIAFHMFVKNKKFWSHQTTASSTANLLESVPSSFAGPEKEIFYLELTSK